MNAHLRPLRDDELPAWYSTATAGYAESIANDGGVPRELAERKAEQDMARLVPDGRIPDGHSVYVIEDAGEAVGRLWLAETDDQLGRALFVYEVVVDEHARGRGLGRVAMAFAEEEARRRGIATVALNVFGGNAVARGLYRSLGYAEVSVFMRKNL